MKRRIIDVYQGNGFISWARAGAYIDGAILKACNGDNEDTSWDFNSRRMLAAGVPLLGAYQFWLTGATTASVLLRTIGPNVCPMGDFEPPATAVINAAQVGAWMTSMDPQALRVSGSLAPFYSGMPYLQQFIMNKDGSWPDWMISRPLWLAEYPNEIVFGPTFDQFNPAHYSYSKPHLPTGWKSWPGQPWLWQLSPRGIIPGIAGNQVDLSIDWPA